MARRAIDVDASSLTLHTRAKGILSRLAHDLEIVADPFEGSVELEGERWSAELRFPVRNLQVVGALRGARVDRSVLSVSDREEIARRIREEHLPCEAVVVRLQGSSRTAGEALVVAARGEQRVRFSMAVEDRRDGETVAEGRVTLSLRALGVGEVKGPLGAFRLDDAVEVIFSIMLSA